MNMINDEPVIKRDPEAAAARQYDLVIIGGGIYGVFLALEASGRQLNTLLIERHDFGSGTSFNSLRIIHGGLRYLQQFDIARLRVSVAERRWFCRHFPDLVQVLPCMMPLYGQGLKRLSTFRVALKLNDWLSRHRNESVAEHLQLGPGAVVDHAGTKQRFPLVREAGLQGSGIWQDVVMLNSERVLIELLRWSCSRGAAVLNYMECVDLEKRGGRVQCVKAVDHETGRMYTFQAGAVINSAGGQCRLLAKRFDRDVPGLFHKTLAFNLLLDHPFPGTSAIAVSPDEPGARTYFLVPWRGMIFAGTYHMVWDGPLEDFRPDERDIIQFIRDLNAAIPGLCLSRDNVIRVYAGLLPGIGPGKADMAHKSVFYDHGRKGGPAGLYTVSGVKYTTARDVAELTLNRIYPDRVRPSSLDQDMPRPRLQFALNPEDPLTFSGAGSERLLEGLRLSKSDESAIHLDDVLLRRMDGMAKPDQIRQALSLIRNHSGWPEAGLDSELSRLERYL